MAVEMISSETPIRPLVFSPGRDGGGSAGSLGGPGPRLPCGPQARPSQDHGSWPPLSLLTQQPPKSDGGREGSEVDEDDGRQALGVQGIPEIAEVLGVTSTDVPDEPPKGSAGALKRVGLQLIFLLLHLQLQQGWGVCAKGNQGREGCLPAPHIPPHRGNKESTLPERRVRVG